jgi:hypothetical protein
MLLVPLAIVRNLWNLALPPWISVLIDSDLKVQEQASAISSGLFAVTVDSDLSKKAAEILLLQQSLRLDSSSGRRERFQLLIDAFKRLVLPNELDRQFLALPRQLSVIYYFARPIRILRTYGFGLCLGAARKLWQTIAG